MRKINKMQKIEDIFIFEEEPEIEFDDIDASEAELAEAAETEGHWGHILK